MDPEPFVLYVRQGPPTIGDNLPQGYSFQVWTPTLLHPVPPTMGLKGAIWTLLHYCGLFGNSRYCVVFIRHRERIVHRSCVLPRYFRWPFMGERDLQVSSTWTEPEFRGKGLASLGLARIVQTMHTACRRLWYVSRESNVASITVCRRAGFEFFAHGTRGAALGLRCLGRLKVASEAAASGRQERGLSGPGGSVTTWYDRYYSRVGADRNDLTTNRGALFQILASEATLVRAFYDIPLHRPGLSVLDVGCGSGGSWYQLFRLGVDPKKTVGIDIQLDRLARVRDLYPQCSAIHADGVSVPFANASFDLVYESTMFATLPDVRVRAGIAAEMLRVCRPNGYLLLVDWRTPKFWDRNYRSLGRAELGRLFGVGQTTSLIGVFPGALVPPLGRLLSTYAGPLYFLIAGLCPPLVGQVVYLLRKNAGPEVQS